MFMTAPLSIKRVLTLCVFLLSSVSASLHAEEEAATQQPAYVELRPEFIVNFQSDAGKLRYIKTSITLQTDTKSKTLIEENLPLIQDALVMFLSSRTSEQVTGGEAREKTREAAAEAVNKALQQETGKAPVKSVLFGSFLTQ